MIHLQYPEKEPATQILQQGCQTSFVIEKPAIALFGDSHVFRGDNLEALRYLREKPVAKTPIDLVYIDPPYATGQSFTVSEKRASTISRTENGVTAYSDELTGYAFLEFLRKRFILIRELMSEQASLYVHIDYKIGHYVKVILDEVFGESRFRSDLTRIKCNPKNFSRRAFGNVKDLILFYTKTDNYIWNEARKSFSKNDLLRLYPKADANGKHYTTVPVHAPGETRNGKTGGEWKGMRPPTGRHWRYEPAKLDLLDSEGRIEWSKNGNLRIIVYSDEAAKRGAKYQDILEYKDPPFPRYPTEKNSELLQLLVATSSNPGSTVLDAFAGSGTTLEAAWRCGRNFIGIDQSEQSIHTIATRFEVVPYTLWKANG
jgi:adenine-specific DNA-methyltransferase